MTICEYCFNKDFTKDQYKNFKNNIESIAKAINSTLTYNGGMYYPVDEILKYNRDKDMKTFIINELKKLNVEFFDNDTKYRVTE